MTRYDFQEAWRVILRNVQTDSQLDMISLLVNLLDELGEIIGRYLFLEDIRVILSNVWMDSQLNLISLLVNFVDELGKIMTR